MSAEVCVARAVLGALCCGHVLSIGESHRQNAVSIIDEASQRRDTRQSSRLNSDDIRVAVQIKSISSAALLRTIRVASTRERAVVIAGLNATLIARVATVALTTILETEERELGAEGGTFLHTHVV